MKSESQEYYLIFDTNVLYHAYDKKADFASFSFSGTYDNVVGFINQLDIYEKVIVLIPDVVWNEMERQIIEAHQLKIKEFREKVAKHSFPEIVVEDKGAINYSEFIRPVIEKYRDNLSSDINTVLGLPVASEACYQSIVKRAFDKQPPFEGKDKKSDKGFKDALLWESILEFTAKHSKAKIIYYSKDNAFGCELEGEFVARFPDAVLNICATENDVKQCLESWAKEIDIYSYTPIEDYVEHREVTEWLQTSDFLIQMIDRDFGLVEKSRLVMDSTVQLLSFDNIQIISQSDEKTEYSIDAVLELTYTLKDGARIKESINACIAVSNMFNEVFTVDNVYMLKELCSEDSATE